MKPAPRWTSTDGRAEIRQAEALRELTTLDDASVDCIITDPPYSSGGMFRSDRMQDPTAKYINTEHRNLRPTFTGDNRDGRSWEYWCALWISECRRVLKPGGYFLMFADWRQLATAADAMQAGGMLWRGTVAWDKTEGSRAPHKGYFRAQCEFIQWGTNGKCPPHSDGPFPGCYRFPVLRRDKHHVTGKPTALLRELVKCAPTGGLILDPFAGSSTTGVAAIERGCRFIGFELESYYFGKSRERLKAAGEPSRSYVVDGSDDPSPTLLRFPTGRTRTRRTRRRKAAA